MRNKRWALRMTDLDSAEARERRRLLAQDVLQELEAGTMQATQDSYATFWADGTRLTIWAGSTTSEKLARVNGYECEVCACGSLAVAAVRKGLVTGLDGVVGALDVFFSVPQLTAIEAVFMGDDWDWDSLLHGDHAAPVGLRELCRPWWDKFNLVDDYADYLEGDETGPDVEGALRAIMENIIKNGGDFNIEDVPT
jgi:hypothetical protein